MTAFLFCALLLIVLIIRCIAKLVKKMRKPALDIVFKIEDVTLESFRKRSFVTFDMYVQNVGRLPIEISRIGFVMADGTEKTFYQEPDVIKVPDRPTAAPGEEVFFDDCDLYYCLNERTPFYKKVTGLFADARKLPLRYRSIRKESAVTVKRQVPDSLVTLLDSLRNQEDTTAQVVKDTLISPEDSLKARMRDSLARADSVAKARQDSLDMLDKSSLNWPAFTTAQDSIVTDFSNGNRLIYYYGGATVTYQDMKLTADYIRFDMSTNTVYARGQLDTLTGEWNGLPEMSQGSASYKMDEVYYNFNTRKARITNMVTTDDEGILHGRDIKMMDDHSINLSHGKYTVCDDDHPHYYVDMSVSKVISQTRQKTVFGPAWPVVGGVPVPIGLPFGFVPEKPTRATGLLMPTFGEEQARGFYMRDAGIYFVLGDYLDFSITGDYYTLGSWAVDFNSRYRVNYKFSGSIALTYSNDQTGEKGSTDFVQSRNFGLRWSHSQDAKAHPGTTFSASVNFSSPSNNKYNSRSVTEAQQNQVSSSISYSRN